jgi:phage tail sheath protein FI
MSTYTYPGVYIEELESAVHTITGVATSIAAFAGWAPQGPVTSAALVQSFSDYETRFGGLDARSYLGYAVNQFFANGGQQAYIIRLVAPLNSTGASTATVSSSTVNVTGGTVTFDAKHPGVWANGYAVQVSPPSNGVAGDFKVSVVYAPQGTVLSTVETLDNLSLASLGAIVSNYITASTGGAPTAPPANGTYPLSGGTDGNGVNVPGAADATVAIGGLTFNSTVSPGTVTIATTTTANTGLILSAANPGAWGNTLSVQIQPRPDDYTRLSLAVIATQPSTGAQSVIENFSNLSLNPNDSQALYVVHVLNERSAYLTASMGATPATLTNAPGLSATPTRWTPASAFLTSGFDGSVLEPTKTAGTPGTFETLLTTAPGGVNLLDQVPLFNLLAVPGEIDPQTLSTLQTYVHDKKAFLIVDCHQNDSFTTLQNGPDSKIAGVNAINSAFYFPWVHVFDPQLKVTRPFPPCGFVAGLYAATDASRGVWKAPAGIDASLTGEAGLNFVLTDLQNGTLNVQAINCIRNFRVYGDVVWGARTLRGNDQVGSQWKYVPIRRLALFLEQSLYEGTQWVVFEPNDAPLWGQIRLNVGSFLQGLFLQGAFAGTTPQQAYFVKCDAENNPPASVAQGIVYIKVGFAPLYPAEFVVIQIAQLAGQTQL